MTRRGPRTDANHAAIVAALREDPDVTVQSLAGVGDGCPDLLIGIRLLRRRQMPVNVTHLAEVKDGEKPPSRQALTPDQERWLSRWTGSTVVILRDPDQARSWVRRVKERLAYQ